MSNKPSSFKKLQNPIPGPKIAPIPISNTVLDKMQDGREFESLLHYKYDKVNLLSEFRKSIDEIQSIRNRPLICYIANIVKPRNVPVSIDISDDLPFNELVSTIPTEYREVDIALVTPGGSAQQVAKFVNTLRQRFDVVNFIILDQAMSAGTILAMSGDDIIMTSRSQIGPIDPQVKNGNGDYVPAQAILTLLDDIKLRGEKEFLAGRKPSWVDVQMLNRLDQKEIGNALSLSNYSIQLVEEYLAKYKFRTWVKHSTTGQPVLENEKQIRAKAIAELLCKHSEWKSHGHAITRETAFQVCKLRITHSETIEGLDRAMKRMWALFYWSFENTDIAKILISSNYSVIRSDIK